MRQCRDSGVDGSIMTVIGYRTKIWISNMIEKTIRQNSYLFLGILEGKIVEFMEHHDEYLIRPYTGTRSAKNPTVSRKAGASWN